jgi:p-methyltransferase
MRRTIDALFIAHYVDRDRWDNDGDDLPREPTPARTRALRSALSDEQWMKDEVDLVVDGKLYDFSRFLSWVRYGDTSEHARYDPFNMTLLAGSYYLDLLSRHGFEVRVANTVDRCQLGRLGREYDPRFVLLSTTLMFDAAETENVPGAVREIRREWPDAAVILGGLMLVSYRNNLPQQAFLNLLRYYGADAYVVSAQGETPLLEILRRGSLAGLILVPNIPSTYLVSGNVVFGPPAKPEEALPFGDPIRWSTLPQTEHLYHTVHMRTARSCAFKCAFCEYPINQGPLTLAPLEAVDAELRELTAQKAVRSVIFTDDTFNVPLRRFKELLKVLARYDLQWYSFFRPQYADPETARLMKESGCRAVFAGLESVDDRMLANMNKNAKADDYRRGIEELKRHDIQVHANFIVGFPGETEESARKISPFIDETGIDFFTVCTWAYIPSTPIGARAGEFAVEGMGVRWKHNTMTSAEAGTLARQIVSEQKSAVHNAVRGEAWTEFLLYANGFDVGEVRSAIGCFDRFLGRDVPGDEIRSSAEYAGLRAVLARHEMPAPVV